MRGLQAILTLTLVVGNVVPTTMPRRGPATEPVVYASTPRPRPRPAAVFLTAMDAPSASQAAFPRGLPRLFCWVRNSTLPPGTSSVTFVWEKDRPHRLIDRFALARSTDLYTEAYETDATGTPGRYRCAVVVGGRVVGSAAYTVTPTAAATQPPPTATAGPQSGDRSRAQPVATSPRGAFAIGDSVMLDAAADLQSHGISVDAAVSRQFDAGLDILRSLAATGRLPSAVVVDLGTNGPISDASFDEMKGVLRGVPRVVFVTVKVPRWWEGEVNSVIRAGVARWPNARRAD